MPCRGRGSGRSRAADGGYGRESAMEGRRSPCVLRFTPSRLPKVAKGRLGEVLRGCCPGVVTELLPLPLLPLLPLFCCCCAVAAALLPLLVIPAKAGNPVTLLLVLHPVTRNPDTGFVLRTNDEPKNARG